jgi:hypothetical protein
VVSGQGALTVPPHSARPQFPVGRCRSGMRAVIEYSAQDTLYTLLTLAQGARCIVVDMAVCYKPEGHGFETLLGE